MAICLKDGASFTISSEIPCTAEAPAGIGMSGFTNLRLTILVPSGLIFTIAISTILSVLTVTPVVSKSINAMGLVNCNFILYVKLKLGQRKVNQFRHNYHYSLILNWCWNNLVHEASFLMHFYLS